MVGMLKIKRVLAIVSMCIVVLGGILYSPIVAYADTGADELADYQEISRQIEEDVERYHIPGMSIVIVDADKVLFSETYGNCDNIDTPFIIGSMSKSFTALAVMQLVEEGRVDLDQKISSYIDVSSYLKNPQDGDKITVRQLLNQTSGLGEYQRFGNAEITDSYGKYQYANVNYSLLGKIIESVTGKNYAEYVEKNIFAPLQMNHSAATLEEAKEDGLIAGYRNYFGFPIAGEPDYPDDSSWSLVPAGYISSSTSDMGKYLQMYLKGGEGIISQSSIETMFYDYVPQDDSNLNYYGMGWGLSNQFSEPMLNHSGLVENYTSNMFILPESGIGIVVLVNMNDYFVDNNLLGNVVLPLLGEEKHDLPGNPYVWMHLLIDLVYLLILIIALYPLFSVKQWKKKNKTKKLLVVEIIRHGVFPVMLLALPNVLGIPMWVIWHYVKDLAIILLSSASILIAMGVYKIVFKVREKLSS